ncbi:hypothetical protein FRC07_000964 [Ceratobasidium sp. 392]|nr:hypothetical protein FRC07_000964 [Ceratobasidium sp. 392]
MASTAEMEDMVDLGHEEGEGEGDQGGLVIDPQLHGLGGTDPMQAVEAIQAALQQIEADADAEKGRVGQ